MAIATVNPATGQTLETFKPLTSAELEAKLACAVEAYHRHRRTTFAERARMMLRAAEILESEKDRFGRLMVTEMGKPIQAARDEAAKSAFGCRYYAENAERFMADEVVETPAKLSLVRYQPIGPILAVMPWNFPFWQVFRFAAPALMAGNVGLLKHASNVPQCALAIEEIFRRAGFPEGVFQTLLIETEQVRQVIEDPRVAAVTLTGSTGAGASVASAAGKVIKKSVLELGGSDPFIVMPSADFDTAVRTAVKARVINNGQSCIAAKRFIVHESIADEFERRFTEGTEALKVGDPMDPATDVGPLATESQVKTIEEQVRRTVAAGARVLDRRRAGRPPRLVLRPDRAGRDHEGLAGLERRGVRPGGDAVPGAEPGRGDPAGERRPLRPRRQRLDPGRGGAGPVHRRDRGRHGVHQRDGGVGPPASVRGCQAVRFRARAGPVRHPGVPQHQNGLDRQLRPEGCVT